MQVINVVHNHGGDVIKFAGDAMIVAFYPLPSEELGANQGYHAAVRRCAMCALEVCSRSASCLNNTVLWMNIYF